MASGSPDLPRVLIDGGYKCHAIESRFAVKGNRLVNPELLLCSDLDGHTLVLDAKSGANLKTAQLERYALIDEEALSQQAFTTPESAKRHTVVIVGQAMYQHRLQLSSGQIASSNRVLCITTGDGLPGSGDAGQGLFPFGLGNTAAHATGIKRIEGDFSTPRLNDAFDPVLGVDWDLVPNNFLPVDNESEPWEFAQYVFPEIIAAILNQESSVRIDEIANSFIRNWGFIAASYKEELRKKIRYVVKVAAQRRFSAFIDFGAKKSGKNEVALRVPDKLKSNSGLLRGQLKRRLRELMEDLNSPQLAMVYED